MIDEWATGIRTDIPFTASDYRSVYEEQVEALFEFERHTSPHQILENVLVRLHNIGRYVFILFCDSLADHCFSFHSGAQPLAAASGSLLKRADIDAAIKEYRACSETESDGEDGTRSE